MEYRFGYLTVVLGVVALLSAGCPDNSGGATTSAACLDTGGDGPSTIPDLPDGCEYLPGCIGEEDSGGSGPKLDVAVEPDFPCEPDPVDPDECCIPDPDDPTECYEPPPFSPGPDDPTWLADTTTGSYYRWTTVSERDVNGWPEDSLLLVNPTLVDAFVNGSAATQTLAVPLPNATGDLGLEYIDVKHRTNSHRAVFVVSQPSSGATFPAPHAFRPEFHTYLPTWINLARLSRPRGLDVFARVYGDSFGGVNIRGVTDSEAFDFIGPTTEVYLEELPPVGGGVLVGTIEAQTIDFDGIVDITLDGADELCDGNCDWATGPQTDPFTCGDCVDNDIDGKIDGSDLGCVHRDDYGCDSAPTHNHGWEAHKGFTILPDIQWCTRMVEQDMPWHTALYAQGTDASLVLNLLPGTAMEIEADKELATDEDLGIPDAAPRLRFHVGACVVAADADAAEECQQDGIGCPSGYELGDTTFQVDISDVVEVEDSVFLPAWAQFNSVADALDDDGITPRPVSIVVAMYDEVDLVDPAQILDEEEGVAHLGNRTLTEPQVFGAAAVEFSAGPVRLVNRTAHEIGHTLGMEHTDPEPLYGNKRGFMDGTEQGIPIAILGPYEGPGADEWSETDEWYTWAKFIGNKNFPRGNGFAHTGCSSNGDCPSPLTCYNSGTDGSCQ